ncbi:metalloregulator ArsR/SmtB family transcription factor [Egibacter rhizosphaerae]|uniref:Metalloregulator ArsR/SmtB family transcription factor n=1 Tax=Egibacter rhizosphaerae TaxID=1670831 RepID=A0A411YFE2_9ACTN|nr:metalloregulator ArsR/SmtB family transcription factor [Egibacter rhizosphaerae]QBI19948.1 metalloregulator ArsR/SmtB family transcription factor [Egibacter rhizosphaerae]
MTELAEHAPDDAAVAAKLFRGLADPTRLAILLELLRGERRVVDLVERIGGSQSNISAHLACLKDCGLVTDRPVGRASVHRLASPAVTDLLRQAEHVLEETGHAVALCPTYDEGTASGPSS